MLLYGLWVTFFGMFCIYLTVSELFFRGAANRVVPGLRPLTVTRTEMTGLFAGDGSSNRSRHRIHRQTLISADGQLAEFTSSWPTSSGPQEWAFQLFPRKMKRAGSYFVAWSLSCLYLFATMASTVIVSKQIAGLAAYRDPTYVPQAVHVWAINVGILFMCAIINLFGIRAMHSIQTFSLCWFICGFFVWLIVPLVKAKGTVGYTPAKDVFTNNDLNLSGWTNFIAFMIGTAGVSAGYGIPDAVTHIAEETKRPEVDLPKIMIMSPIISLVTATAMCLSFLFCNVPQITMALSPTGVPFIDFLDATVGHRAGVTVMVVILIYAQFVACLECQLASSRTLFTFAREGGAFFPSVLGRVNLTLQVPVWTILFNFVFCAALTLLLLGSETALNVFLTAPEPSRSALTAHSSLPASS